MHYAALCIVCLIIASLLLFRERDGYFVQAVLLKGLASLCFVILGFLCASHVMWPRPATLIFVGLVLGAVADVLLNLRQVFVKVGQTIFLVGILVFLSGHIAYLAAVLPLCPSPILALLAAAVLTFFLMRWIFGKITAKKAFKIFGVVYIGAIVFLNCVAIANLFSYASTFNLLFAAGALLFLVSDIVLILNTFGPENKFSLRFVNLMLYYVGQLVIALSCLFLR
ncbi:MAG: lysoplasmalogenase [Oscillospiraceae bacterium]|nr:lysoplasmalogenase [Oscillospiraceae bacterium]